MSNSDLSGKIVFKVKLGKEIKKIVIHNDDINYNELLLMMQRIFSDKIKPNDDILMKYTDEENDLITLSNDSDVLLALQSSKILKLTLFLKDKEDNIEEAIKPTEIVKELYNIRLSIDSFLEKFERSLKLSDVRHHQQKVDEPLKSTSETKLTSNSTNALPHLIKSDAHKEFDPLGAKKENNLAKNYRSQTPDSINSIESSPSQSKFSSFNTNGIGHQAAPLQQQHQSFQPSSNQMIQPQQPQEQANLPVQHQQQFQNFNQPPQVVQPPPPQQQQQPPTQQFFQNQMAPNAMNANAPSQLNQYGPPHINPALKGPPQPTNMLHQQAPNMQQQQQQQQPFGFQNDPQAAAYYQQQQLHQQQGPVPTGFQQQQQQQPPSSIQHQGANPYSKGPNQSMARPPSATMYQQGYK
jgi:protein TFG